MPPERILSDFDQVKRLAEKLAACPRIARFDDADHREAWVLADALKDLEGELLNIQQVIRDLQAAPDCEEVAGTLGELSVSLQHIVYHCVTTRYFGQDWFRTLLDDAEQT